MQKLNKKDVQDLYARCMRHIKKTPHDLIRYRRLRGVHGYYNWHTDNSLEFDYRGQLGRTLFHEVIHAVFPEWCETQVVYAESRIINTCAPIDIAKFIKVITEKLYVVEIIKQRKVQSAARKKKRLKA
jgi:Fe-S cluster biosynthesis and repair protein YggX